MKKKIPNLICFILFAFLFQSCEKPEGIIEISYEIQERSGNTPTYCTAIWLENTDGTFVKTLFSSSYLADVGYQLPGICPNWVEKSNWSETHTELLDAVSGATPLNGKVRLQFECYKQEVPIGLYNYFIEVNIEEDINEIYTGEIEIGKETNENIATVKYSAGQNDDRGIVFSGVKVSFQLGKRKTQ